MEGQNFSQGNHQNHKIAVVMVPFPAQGHLNLTLHLSHHLTSYNIPVHYAGSTTHNHQAKLRIHGWDSNSLNKIHFHDFNLPSYISPSPDPSVGTQFPAHLQPLYDASLHLREPVSQLVQELATQYRRVIVIHDIPIASVVQDVKSISNAEAYAVLSISAFTMFFGIWQSMHEKPFQLDHEIDSFFSLPSSEGCITNEIIEFMNYQYKFMDFQSGTIYNTSKVIEGKYLDLLVKQSMNQNMKHFAFGPFHPIEITSRNNKEKHECLKWLDNQEKDSVIYVSFGSSTTMCKDQINELADGLEKSGQNFLWVLRNADKGDIFEDDEANKTPQLPKGYEERVKNRGIVVKDWAPQLEILSHTSIGGFMSHCGWNSCLESISMGVPILGWPMHSDQPMNCILVSQVLGIGTMVRDWTDQGDLVMSSVIENGVMRLMGANEGLEMRSKAVELGEKVRKSIANGGVSHSEMELFIAHITR